MNPFAPLYAQCNTGDPAEKWANLADFPRIIDIELTSACNFRCLMCPTGNLSLRRPAVMMREDTFSKIAGQCAVYGTALRFIGWGEPTMHPGLPRFVAAADRVGLITHLNTNGSRQGKILHAILCGLSSLKFSFQGIDAAGFHAMRNIDGFDLLLDAIKDLAGHNNQRAWLAVSTTITDETPEQVAAFVKRVGPLVDEVSVGATTFDFMDFDAVRLPRADRERLERLAAVASTEKRHPDPCPEVFDKLSIHADGSVVLCCNDFDGVATLGNVKDTPIAELWRHPKIEAYRERLARKDYDAPLCKDCWDYMDCTRPESRFLVTKEQAA